MVHQCAYAMCICFAVSYFVWKAASGSFVPCEETYGIEKKEKLRSKLPMLLSALQLESDWVLTTFDGRAHLTDSASADSYRSVRVFRNSEEKNATMWPAHFQPLHFNRGEFRGGGS